MNKTIPAALVMAIILDIIIGVLQWAKVIPSLSPIIVGVGTFVASYLLLSCASQNS